MKSKKLPQLPKKFRCGPRTFKIIAMPDTWGRYPNGDVQLWGQFDDVAHAIFMRNEYPSPAIAVDAFIHESIHAVYCVYNVKGDDDEERTTHTVATGLTNILQSPAIRKWIDAMLASEGK